MKSFLGALLALSAISIDPVKLVASKPVNNRKAWKRAFGGLCNHGFAASRFN